MQSDAFAAQRREQLQAGDERLGPIVANALSNFGADGWADPIVDAAGRIWLENYAAEAPDAAYRAGLMRFRQRVAESLEKTTESSNAERITRWLSTYAVNAGTIQGAYRRGVRFKTWVDMEDAAVRDTHRHAAGQVVPIGGAFTVGGVKMGYPGEPVGPIELWINCVVGSTQVEGAGQSVLSLSRRQSLGSLVEIRTVDGHHLTVTPNHPVLTPGGYVPAEALSPGDKVMATGVPVSPEVSDAPPSIEEFYRAARETGNSARMDGGGVDFHGDAAESEVEVVWPNRDLPLEMRRQFGEPEFIVTDSGELSLVGSSLAHPTIPAFAGESVGTGDLTLRGVGIGREVAALLSAHAPHPKSVRLAGGPDRQVESFQIPGHHIAADAEVVRHLEYAIAAGMSPSEVVSVEIHPVVGATHVYNLHTSANWYSANGIAVHNCRCVAQPAARSGETMSESTLDLGSNTHTRALIADAGAEEPRTGALVVLLPAADDPITAATSEDQAHMTTIWFGDVNEMPVEPGALQAAVAEYAAALDGPLVVPVKGRGLLGDDDADVVFLERTDSLDAMRDGLLADPDVQAAFDAAEQYPDWTPHVTLGYPEGVEGGPAVGEYDGTEVTFDRLGLWLGGDYTEYPMGGVVSDTITADAAAQEPGIPAEEYEADDELEDDEEPITEIPVHGVLAPEGVETGDGRGFREGAISSRPLPYPLRLEVVGTHGGTTSDVVTVGRIDEAWRDDATGMWRFRGAIILSKPQASAAIEGIIDGSGTGVSIDADAMAVDMEGFSDEAIVTAEAAGKNPTTWFSETRIAGLTIVPIPAFHEAYIALGHDFVEDMTDEQITAAAGILEDCGCGETAEEVRYGGHMDNMEAWRDPSDGHLTSSTTDPKTTSAGSGRATATAKATAESLSRLAAARQLIESYSSAAGASSQTATSSTTPVTTGLDVPGAATARTADASTPATSNPSLTPSTSPEARLTTASASSVATDSTTSLVPTAGTSGSKTGSSGALAASVGSPSDGESRSATPSGATASVSDSFAPGTRDGRGWITNPIPTSRIRRYWVRGEGAAKIRWGEGGDFNRCRAQLAKYVQNPEWLAGLCANMHKEALGIWPAQHAASARAAVLASGALPSPMINLVDSESDEAITAAAGFPGGFPAEWFANPKFRQLTPLTIDKESGRIFGHLAQWGVCHIGVSGSCVKPPHSRSNYANFLKGVVDTTAGEQPVGCFTYGIGHADPRLRAAAATAHYDRPDAVVAYVNVGEDSFGIWYAGVLRPGVDEQLVDEFRAVGAVSGDWRPIGRFGLDLVASVAVNTPGFPVSIAASGGEVTALIAAGMVMQAEPEPESTPESFADANADFLAAAIAKAMDKRENQKREQTLRQRAHTIRQADLRRRAQKKG